MRIALVGPSAPLRGGIAQHTDRLASWLGADAEVDLYPYARQYPTWLFPGRTQRDEGGVTRAEARVPFDPYAPRTWSLVADDIARRLPDLVIAQWWHPWFALPVRGLLARLVDRGVPRERLAVVCHNALPHRPVPLQRWLTRLALGRAGRFMVHARAEEARLRDVVGPDLVVHRSALPLLGGDAGAPDRAAARASMGLGDAPLVLFFGLVREYKGVLDLVDALPRMERRDARLLIAGEVYGGAGEYRSAIAASGVADRVTLRDEFIPARDVAALFAAADVVALPYRRASQSAVLPLAIAHRRRFVVTDAGGLVEAAGGLGEVAPPRDPAALARALDAALARGPVPEAGDEAERWRRAASASSEDGVRGAYRAMAVAARGGATAPGAGGPVASIVVAAHAGCAGLERTLRALEAQDAAPPHEVLVLHDGDAEALRARLAAAGIDAPRVVAEPRLALSAKRNRGLAEAAAPLVLFTDEDCEPDPGWTARMVRALGASPVVTGRVLPLGDGVRASLREGTRPRRFHRWRDRLLPWRVGSGNNLGVRREVALALGGFDERLGVGTWAGAAEDTEFLLRALHAAHGVTYDPEAVVRHRLAPLEAATIDKRRRYYRGPSFVARRVHPRDATVWASALLRLGASAVRVVGAAVRIDGEALRLRRAELRGAAEGLFPPQEANAPARSAPPEAREVTP